jgi:hypothetical protein
VAGNGVRLNAAILVRSFRSGERAAGSVLARVAEVDAPDRRSSPVERLTVDEMTLLAVVRPDQGGSTGDPDGADDHPAHAYWVIEGSDRHAAVGAQVAGCSIGSPRPREVWARALNADSPPSGLALLARIGAGSDPASAGVTPM